MFKVLLIVYVIGGGNNITYTSGLEFQEFHSVDDCENVRDEIKALKTSQTYKDDSPIPFHYATKCVEMKTTGNQYQSSSSSGSTEEAPPPPEPPAPTRNQSRWND